MANEAPFPNRNALWAELLVDEWARLGLRHVALGPGSRNTPLAVAFHRHPQVRVWPITDERAAAFFALGLARATRTPTAVLTTSGTATANVHPAVLEAAHSFVPLLVLTADRPAELIDSGANQTTRQAGLYGPAVRWFHHVAPPEAAPPARLLRYLRTVADRAWAYARGWAGPPGPVHLNLPFRKPLEPVPVPEDVPYRALAQAEPAVWGRADGGPYTHLQPPAALRPPEDALLALAEGLAARPRGLILAGPAQLTPQARRAWVALARALGYPLLADPLSGLRFGPWFDPDWVLTGYPRYLEAMPRPQVVLQVGAAPVGRAALRYLENLPDDAWFVSVSGEGAWTDPAFRLTHSFWSDPAAFAQALAELATQAQLQPDSTWLAGWRQAERAAWAQPFGEDEGRVLAYVVDHAPAGSILMVGNSLPVRHLEEQGRGHTRAVEVHGNRGLSGIDGQIATATGLALHAPTLLVLGDQSLLHDVGSLALAPRFRAALRIVVINNNGGRIFERLPIRRFDPPFTQAFRAPHGLHFEHAAAQFGWAYQRLALEDPRLPEAIRRLWHAPGPTLLEVQVDWPLPGAEAHPPEPPGGEPA